MAKRKGLFDQVVEDIAGEIAAARKDAWKVAPQSLGQPTMDATLKRLGVRRKDILRGAGE